MTEENQNRILFRLEKVIHIIRNMIPSNMEYSIDEEEYNKLAELINDAYILLKKEKN